MQRNIQFVPGPFPGKQARIEIPSIQHQGIAKYILKFEQICSGLVEVKAVKTNGNLNKHRNTTRNGKSAHSEEEWLNNSI